MNNDELANLPIAEKLSLEVKRVFDGAPTRLWGARTTKALHTRVRRILEKLQITTIGQLVQTTERDLLRNCGPKSVLAIRDKLGGLGLALKS